MVIFNSYVKLPEGKIPFHGEYPGEHFGGTSLLLEALQGFLSLKTGGD
jgi:hypothetical protein